MALKKTPHKSFRKSDMKIHESQTIIIRGKKYSCIKITFKKKRITWLSRNKDGGGCKCRSSLINIVNKSQKSGNEDRDSTYSRQEQATNTTVNTADKRHSHGARQNINTQNWTRLRCMKSGANADWNTCSGTYSMIYMGWWRHLRDNDV